MLTSDGAKIINSLGVKHPIEAILMEYIQQMNQIAGDGTTSCLLITLALLRNAYTFYNLNHGSISMPTIRNAITNSMTYCAAYLNSKYSHSTATIQMDHVVRLTNLTDRKNVCAYMLLFTAFFKSLFAHSISLTLSLSLSLSIYLSFFTKSCTSSFT